MTNKQILKAAIEKTEKNGFNIGMFLMMSKFDGKIEAQDLIEQGRFVCYSVIFSHDFARAFWGEGKWIINGAGLLCWQYHLQQMVLEEDPIQYLEQFLA